MQSAAATASLPRPGSDAVVFCILCPGHFANTNKKNKARKRLHTPQKKKRKSATCVSSMQRYASARAFHNQLRSSKKEHSSRHCTLLAYIAEIIHQRKKNGFPKTHATAHKHHMQHTPHAFSRVPAKLTPCVVDLPRGLITLSRSVASHVKVSWLHQLFSLWSYSHAATSERSVCVCV